MEEKPKRKMWWQAKIEELEAKVAELSAQQTAFTGPGPDAFAETSRDTTTEGTVAVAVQTGTSIDTNSYAQGVYDALCKYSILSKEMRKRVRDNIISSGPDTFQRKKNPWTF